jgi:pimeloyl-ACP methyl ester carboxylesterase
VEAFDLLRLGDDHTPVSDHPDACATRLCDVLAKSPEPSIVAGNSMGGIIVTQGAARTPAVAALVYGRIHTKGRQSLLDLTKLPEGSAIKFKPISL